MRTTMLYNGEKIPRIGLGTWQIGGGMSADRTRDDFYLGVLHTALKLGYVHIDTAELYGAGHTEELVGRAIQGHDRQDLFITTKVWHTHLRYQEVHQALEKSLVRLGTDFVDLYLIHWPNPSVPLEDTFQALNEAVHHGKVRHVGVSNFNLDQLKKSQSLSEIPIATNQVPYSLFNRTYVRNGVLAYCQQNQIILTAYSPVKKGVVHHPLVKRIAAKYDATPTQVALNWLVHQPAVITIPMSTQAQHLDENLGAVDLTLSQPDIDELDKMA